MKKGFTLIELLIVIAVTAVVFSAAFPDFGKAANRLELETLSQDIAGTLRMLRQRSWTSAAQTELDIKKTVFKMKRYDPVSDSIVVTGSRNFPKGILLDSPVNFKFAASGFPLAGYSGTAILRDPSGRTKKIVVSSFGRIRIE